MATKKKPPTKKADNWPSRSDLAVEVAAVIDRHLPGLVFAQLLLQADYPALLPKSIVVFSRPGRALLDGNRHA